MNVFGAAQRQRQQRAIAVAETRETALEALLEALAADCASAAAAATDHGVRRMMMPRIR